MRSNFCWTNFFFYGAYFSSYLRNTGEKSKKTQKWPRLLTLGSNISAHRVFPDIRLAAADAKYSLVLVFDSFRKKLKIDPSGVENCLKIPHFVTVLPHRTFSCKRKWIFSHMKMLKYWFPYYFPSHIISHTILYSVRCLCLFYDRPEPIRYLVVMVYYSAKKKLIFGLRTSKSMNPERVVRFARPRALNRKEILYFHHLRP